MLFVIVIDYFSDLQICKFIFYWNAYGDTNPVSTGFKKGEVTRQAT